MALPSFSANGYYLLRGETLQAIVQELRTNRPCCVSGGHLTMASQDPATIGAVAGDGGGQSIDPGTELPQFQAGAVYLLRQATIDKLFKAANRNITKVVTGGGLSVSYGSDGVTISST